MGFLKKLFEKKECAFCGGEIGLLGNRKLEDGNMCKDCAKKLSPWFDERRHSTVEQIRIQLEARERNRVLLKDFRHDLVLGEYYKVYIMRIAGVPQFFAVSRADDYKEENADLLLFSMVTSCAPDIRESRTELKRNNGNGEQVSYNPPRYKYRYEFYIKLELKGHYIDDMRFKLNRSAVELETVMPTGGIFLRDKRFDPMLYPEYRTYQAMVDEICEVISCGQRGVVYGMGSYAVPVAVRNPQPSPTPLKAQGTNAQSVPTWVCDSCGSENTGKFCLECGAKKPEPAPGVWTCSCGSENTGKFCQECGKRFC